MIWTDGCAVAAATLARPKRQRVLDMIRAGVTLGDAAWVEDISLQAVCGIMDASISERLTLLEVAT
jgi:hypothetical protein